MPQFKDSITELNLLIDACHAAGAIAMQFYKGAYTTELKAHAGHSPVTEADLAVDKYLRETLTAARPSYGWLSEETEDDTARLNKERVWIVDPIDGTKSFIRQDDMFAVSAALVENGVPIAGVVHNPAKAETMAACVGGPLMLNGVAVKPRKLPAFEEAICLASTSEMRRGLWQDLAQELTVVPISSIAYKLALVAVGRMDMLASLRPKSEWDIAAGVALCAAAGVKVTDLHGKPFTFNHPEPEVNGVIAAPEALFDPLFDKVRQHGGRRSF